ncbi:PAS domain S-box-containing protein [Bacillus sp. OV322]|uniref:MASE3 domain-containing protein n=1 Tax=Bacillus sp. OV322 TaxID=1882764 RepID=UPI0008DFDAEF|nr:MASE3 domain-containing protein [Bacillus sp. OV322]SFC30146.1 PAS domain S-box-containing protein [Bacillus sp. OV322]
MKKIENSSIIMAIVSFCVFLPVLVNRSLIPDWTQYLESHYTFIHIILELASTLIVFTIVLLGIFFYKYSSTLPAIILAGSFIATGVFDLFHTLTYKGLANDIVDNSFTFSNLFWITARFTESIALLLVIFLPKKGTNDEITKNTFIAFSLYAIFISLLIFLKSESFPALFQNGSPTILKNCLEYLFALLHAMVLARGLFLYKSGGKREYLFLAAGACLLMFSSILFASYEHYYDQKNFLGHIFKIIGYFYLFRAVIILLGERPYETVKVLSEKYSRLLDTVVEGIYGTDLDGRLIFVNASGTKMLGYREDELIGRKLHPLIHHTKADGTRHFEEDCVISNTSRTGLSHHVKEDCFWRKDGTPVPVEFFTRPILEGKNIVGTVVTFFDISQRKQLEVLQNKQNMLDHEIDLAVSVQQSLLSAGNQSSDLENIGVVSKPFKKLNGDFYAFVQQPEGMTIAIADVCGKGIPAAIQMTMMKFAMEANRKPPLILEDVNRFFAKYMDNYSFITMLVGFYNQDTKIFSYSSAGHEPALLYKTEKDEFTELTTGDPIIGIHNEFVYQSKDIQLEEGDYLLLYTDGIIEKKNNKIDNNDVLREAFRKADLTMPVQYIADSMFDAIRDYHGPGVYDDQTLIVVRA